MMKTLTHFSRLFVGLLFIFSGFIKANDAIGFSYKLVEYFEVLDLHFFIPIALPLSIFICVFEIVIGFTLLMGTKVKLTLWLLLLMIVFFTFLTFYSAYYQKVLSCGCFGDAIPLTPWESFSKDLILLVLIIILFIGKDYIKPIFGKRLESAILVLVVIASTVFPIYTYAYLPVIDFRAYAIGKNIPTQMIGIPDETKYYYSFEDTSTGEMIESEKWLSEPQYVYDTNRVEITKKGVEAKIKDLTINDLAGADYTQDIIENPDYNFLIICYDIAKTDREVFGKLNDFAALCEQDGLKIFILTASTKGAIEAFKQEVDTTIDFYNTDGTVLKTIIRSNPGLMLLKEGTVLDKWHHNSFPSYNDVKDTYLKK